jgi:hypothetical protein
MPPADDYDDGDDEDSGHHAHNTLEGDDEIERENDDTDGIGVNWFEIEDLNVHGRKWQAYIKEKQQLLKPKVSVV